MNNELANEIYEEFADLVADQEKLSWRETSWWDAETGEEGHKFSVVEKNLIIRLIEVTENGNPKVKFQYWFVKNPGKKTDITSLQQLLELL